MWQALIPLVVRFILSTVAKNLPMDEWKAKTKVWVQSVVPGTWFDEAAWAIVDGAWDVILGEVVKQFPKGVHHRAGMTDVWKAVSHVTEAVTQKVGK